MRTRTKILLGIGFTILVVLIVSVLIGFMLVRKSFPKTSGSITLPLLQRPVEILRDEYGVPHIVAESEHDAYFAVGFVHAQDRLWQMEVARRAGLGRLAEVLGDSAVKFDRMFRTLGLSQMASHLTAAMDRTTHAALQSYAEGVNAFIETHRGEYPIEFDMLGIEPEPWSVEHTAIISRLMAWELNYSRWMDIVLGALVEKLGKEKAAEVFPGWKEGAPFIVPPELMGKSISLGASAFLKTELEFRKFLGGSGLSGGSNSWAISGTKSATGKPILANDPHLMFLLPGRWYELHVTAPGLDVQGTTIAGVPFVVIGRNRHIAWGLTNAMADDQDFFVEEVDSVQHPTKYRVGNEWAPITERVDTILVKGNMPILLTSYHTSRGPIVNRIEPSADLSARLLSMKWVGHEISDEATTFYLLNRARTWKEFRDAIQHFGAPAQNFIYADVEGNIGYQLGGRIPIRKAKGHTLPFPGWTQEYEWRGYVPYEQLPSLFNPPEGFVATANNKIVSDSYPYYISDLWEPHWRITRIVELLKSQEKFTIEDVQQQQMDLFSVNARELVPPILAAFPDSLAIDQQTQTVLTYFRNWTGHIRAESVAASLFQVFLVRLVFNTLHDEMGDEIFYHYQAIPAIPLSVVTRLTLEGSSEWFDNINTPERETRDDVIRLSLREALAELSRLLSGELKEWRWGRLHTVKFDHVFGAHPLLGPIFNVGPFPVGGSHATINKGDFDLNKPFRNTVGPSTRQIFDLGDPNNNRAITPPGQSGQVFHPQYDDQIQPWLAGAYRTFPMNLQRVRDGKHDRLLLKPLP